MNKLIVLALSLGLVDAFTTSSFGGRALQTTMKSQKPEDLGFTPWKPPQGEGDTTDQYGSTDTPDYFEEAGSSKNDVIREPTTTAADASASLDRLMDSDSWTIGGKKAMTDRPKWFKAKPGMVDGTVTFTRSGETQEVIVTNGAMGFEDFFADFSDECVGSFGVTPVTGTLERRGGPPQDFQITYLGDGTPGTTGHLIVMTEEEKFTFELVVP